jgi:hypothetical protein
MTVSCVANIDRVNARRNDALMNLLKRTCGWNTNKCKVLFYSSLLLKRVVSHNNQF